MGIASEGRMAEYQADWYQRNKERLRGQRRAYRQRPEIRERERLRDREWRERNAERLPEMRKRWGANGKAKAWGERYRAKPESRRTQKNNRLMRQYGITLAQYEQMLEAQGHVCAVCLGDRPTMHRRSRDPAKHSRAALHVDHDHQTGKVRGLLCGHCNRALGLLRETPTILLRAAEYLGS